jgi:hypothetical protein
MIPRPLAHEGLLEDIRKVDSDAQEEGFTGKVTVTLEWDFKDGQPAQVDWIVLKKAPRAMSGRRWLLWER